MVNWNSFWEFISIFNNLFQFLISFVGITTLLFVISRKYIEPVTTLYKKRGLGLSHLIKVLWICKRKPKTLIRNFVEYAAFYSAGRYLSKTEWADMLIEFEDDLKQNGTELTFAVDNCLTILSNDFIKITNEYFTYFKNPKVRETFLIDTKEPIGFITQLEIKEGQLSSLVLLNGLLSRYEDNWSAIISRYISSNFIAGDVEILAEELYFTFAWLLWGPSIELKGQDNFYKLCQYSYGDESNSVKVILEDTDAIDPLWSYINRYRGKIGVTTAIKCRLMEEKDYLEKYIDRFNPQNNYYLSRDDDDSQFILSLVDHEVINGYKGLHYYCTAYVWIIFEADNKRKAFSPQNSVVFFEHANIVNKENYEFSVKQLIEKCFNHFDIIFADEKYDNRTYNYCLSMNSYIDDLFKAEYARRIADAKGHPYQNRININTVYSERDVFFEIDRFFSCNANLKSVEVNIEDPNTINDLAVFYTSIYINEFKDPNERETLENMLASLKDDAEEITKNRYHIILVKNLSGTIVGGAIFDYFHETNSGVIEFISVGSAYQSMGIGSFLYNTIYEKLNQDSKENNKITLANIFCEIEDPHTLAPNASKKYYAFWKKYGFRKLDFKYIQPSLDESKSSVDTLWLLAYSLDQTDKSKLDLSPKTVSSVTHDYIKYAMRIEDPHQNPYYQKMHKEISSYDSINLLSLSDLYTEEVNHATR